MSGWRFKKKYEEVKWEDVSYIKTGNLYSKIFFYDDRGVVIGELHDLVPRDVMEAYSGMKVDTGDWKNFHID